MNRNRPSDITVRMATPRDAKEIVAIYARYVQSTAISFEYEVPSVSEFTRRITKTLDQYPWLVCVHHGSIVGYACAHQFCARSAYQWNAELTIYMDQFHTGNGIGSLLYRTLFTILKEQNILNVYSLVTVPNPSSDHLHQKFGFQSCGIWPQTGYKFEQWLDVQVYWKSLGNHACPPGPFRPLHTLNHEHITALIQPEVSAFNAS